MKAAASTLIAVAVIAGISTPSNASESKLSSSKIEVVPSPETGSKIATLPMGSATVTEEITSKRESGVIGGDAYLKSSDGKASEFFGRPYIVGGDGKYGQWKIVDGKPVATGLNISENDRVSFAISSLLIDRVVKSSDRGQPRWMVYPTIAGRAASGEIHATFGWWQAKDNGVPDKPNLYDQYLCHPMSLVARVKSSWNLEEWRPHVHLPATIAAGCNPGGGDD